MSFKCVNNALINWLCSELSFPTLYVCLNACSLVGPGCPVELAALSQELPESCKVRNGLTVLFSVGILKVHIFGNLSIKLSVGVLCSVPSTVHRMSC